MEVQGSGCTASNNSKVLNVFSFWPPAQQQKEIEGVTEGFLFLPDTAKSFEKILCIEQSFTVRGEMQEL